MRDPIDDTHAGLTGWVQPVERLRQALERDEFVLYAQAILALKGGGYPMAELLVRLREEETALLPPGDFFPAFEHYRMMPQLDRWVVRAALKRLAAAGPIARFTVNVSSQTLEDAEFPRFVAAQLASTGVAGERLLFEIDEMDTLVRADAAVRFAKTCHGQGVRVLVDGFGRRSVSFATLKDMGADFVKVDGGIVRKLLTSPLAATRVGAILRVRSALGYAVVAEFVEEQDVLARLKALGVDYAQGFGIHQPQAVESLALSG